MSKPEVKRFKVSYLCPHTGEWTETEETAQDWLDESGKVFQTARQVIEDWAYNVADKGPFEIEEL